MATTDTSKKSENLGSEANRITCEIADDYQCDHASSVTISQQEFSDTITDYFLKTNFPLRKVEELHFRKMFTNLNIDTMGLKIISSSSLHEQIEDFYNKKRSTVRNLLKDVKHVSLSTNCFDMDANHWLVTRCHWISSDLKRKSYVISLRQVADSLSNCIGTSIYNIKSECIKLNVAFDDLKNLIIEDHDLIINDTDGQDSFHVFDSILTVFNVTRPAEELRLHRCVLFKLKTHFNSIIKNDFKSSCMYKCEKLWELAEKHEYAECIQNILGHSLLSPKNKDNCCLDLYKPLKQILSTEEKSNKLHSALSLNNELNGEDFKFIREFVKSFEPIAKVSDFLVNNKDNFYGVILPCLLSLRRDLIEISSNDDNDPVCKNLSANYLNILEKAFNNNFNLTGDSDIQAAIAAMSYPRFKDKWLSSMDSQHHNKIKAAFQQSIIEAMGETDEPGPRETYDNESFFMFDSDSDNTGVDLTSKAQSLMNLYLSDTDKQLSMLDRHSEVKTVFIKYNTSVPIIRLQDMSFIHENALEINSAANSDQTFANMIVLKCDMNES